MALSKIDFIKGSGGLTRRSTSEDGISGLLYYGTVPTEFGSDKVKQIFSLTEAETLGITEADLPILHYHVSEFFRVHKGGSLFVGIYAPEAEGTAHDFVELLEMQTSAAGRMRQVGVFTGVAYTTAMVTALQTACANASGEHQPLNAVLVADLSGEDLTTIASIKTLAAPNVSVLIGQDGGGVGADLFASEGVTVGALGACIGAIAKSFVHESIAWVGKFNVGGSELDVLAFGEGTAYRNVSNTLLNELSNKGYIFLQKQIGIGGSYFCASWTASTGDYDTIEKNRAIDKAIRLMRATLLPYLSSPLYVNPTSGKLSEDTIQALSNEANRPLSDMVGAGELSGARAFIDPDQNVLSTDELEVIVELVPVGVARTITVKIGYTVQLSQN